MLQKSTSGQQSQAKWQSLGSDFSFPMGTLLVLEVLGFQSMSLADGKALPACFPVSSSLLTPLVKIFLLKSRFCLLLVLCWILTLSISLWKSYQESMAVLATILHPHQHRALLNLSPLCGVFLFSRYCLRKGSPNPFQDI